MTIKFEGTNLITAVGVGASFSDADIGAKLIAPSLTQSANPAVV